MITAKSSLTASFELVLFLTEKCGNAIFNLLGYLKNHASDKDQFNREEGPSASNPVEGEGHQAVSDSMPNGRASVNGIWTENRGLQPV